MKEIKFQIEGVDGDFFVDADEVRAYSTCKAMALADKNPAAFYQAMERIYMGHDEEYAERVSCIENGIAVLNDAAAEAVLAKN